MASWLAIPAASPKRGTHSVGVQRQWCGHRGKVDNCQVGVFMGYVSRQEHTLLDFRLSLSEEWTRDEPRRQACHVPPEGRYQTRHEQCLEMLDAWGGQVPHGWVTGDDELGRHTRFRHALRERGERYVLGVPCTTTMRDLEARLPKYQGRGRRPKAPWQSVMEWRKLLPAEGWTQLAGPAKSEAKWLPVKLVDRTLLMGHQHPPGALVELRQIGKTASGADGVLHDPPEAFDGVEVVPTMGR